MLDKDPSVFESSDDPKELVDMARIYAASDAPEDQARVFALLDSRDFLVRLNTEQEYRTRRPLTLDVARVVKTLMQQEHAAAHDTLVNLTEAPTFQSFFRLVELNIRALAVDRPASPRSLAYWHRHSTPTSSNIGLVIDAIFENHTEPALRMFEAKMNDPEHDDMHKLAWLRDALLRKRNDPEVLQFCEGMLVQSTLDAKWHDALLEVLFDYNEGWYRSCSFPRPPERLLASTEAKDTMERIARHALEQLQLYIPGLRAKIRAAMASIGRDPGETERSA